MVNPFEERLKSRKSNPFEKRLSERDKEETEEPEEERSFMQKVKDYFTQNKLGEAAAMQMQSGGFAGAPTATPKQAKKIATEVATIAAVEAAFVPIIGAAAASEFIPGTLTALTRLTQAGATGAATATTSKLVEEGELPTPEEIFKDGVTWMAIDAAMQMLHLTAAGGKKAYDFGRAVSNIADSEGVSKVDVLNKLWESSKNYLEQNKGRKISTPEEIIPSDVEVLIEEAKKKEREIPKTPIEIDITPKEESFTTSKGSTYQVHPDGSTTRTKAARAEHPGDEGIQPKSQKTYYLTPEQADQLSEIQASGPTRRINELPDGSIGIQYETGEHKGKFEKRTVVTPKTSPEKGLIPLEIWEDGKAHFGNKITDIEGKPKTKTGEEKFPSGLSKPKAVENPHTSKAIISPERQKKAISEIDKEAANLAKEKVEKHLPIVKQIEEGFDFEGRFEKGFSKVRKIAKKYNADVDITDVSDYLSKSRSKVGYFPKELLAPEQKKIIAEIKALRQHPQTQLKKLIDLFRLNNKKRSQIYETRHITGKQRDYVDFLTGLNKAIVKSMERTFPENSQWLNYFKNLNGEYSRYINAKKTLQMLENILQGNASQAHLNKFIVNPKMQKRLELSMGKEGAESLIQLIKDMKIARDAIKSIPTRKLKEMDAIYPLGLVIPGLKVPTAIAASRKIVEYGKRAFGWYLTTPESTEALDRAIRSLTRQDVSEYKKATDELKKNQSKNS